MATIDSTLTEERVNKAKYVRAKVIKELQARGYKDGTDFHTEGDKRTSAPKLKLMLIDDITKRSLQQVGRQGVNDASSLVAATDTSGTARQWPARPQTTPARTTPTSGDDPARGGVGAWTD